MRKEKGITLIALVITIIVLLILAGVAIVTLTGDNGLLQKAQTAKEENEEAKELELIKLAVVSAKLAGEGKLNTTNLRNELETNLNDNDIDNNLKPISDYWKYKGYKIDNDGNVEKYDKLLPDEYQQVEYIESSGTQYIDTKYIPNQGSRILADVNINDTFINGYYQAIFGATTVKNSNEESRCSLHLGNVNQDIIVTYGNTAYRSGFKDINNKRHIYEWNKNTFNVDSNYISSTNQQQFIIEVTLNIFRENNSINQNKRLIKMRLYSFEIYENKAICKFIPCYTTVTVTDVDGKQCSAGTVGLYDTVEGKFYTNQGTGKFGYETEDGTYVAPTNN